MRIRYLPGKPNRWLNSFDSQFWDDHYITAYCSGNSLIVISDTSNLLQTIYLDGLGAAVSIDNANGWIAVAASKKVYVYRPIKRYGKPLSWALESQISEEAAVNVVSWAGEHQLLTGSFRLALWDVSTCSILTSQTLPAEIESCSVSSDKLVAATFGFDDPFLKVWQRSSFDTETLNYDFEYLAHPAPLLWTHWRSVGEGHRAFNVLYTFAKDRVLRVWAPIAGSNYVLWAFVPCNTQNPILLFNEHCNSYQNLQSSSSAQKHAETKVSDLIVLLESQTFSIVQIGNLDCSDSTKLANVTVLVEKAPAKIYAREHIDFSRARIFLFRITDSVELIVQFPEHYIAFSRFDTSYLHETSRSVVRILKPVSYFAGHTKSVKRIKRSSSGDTLFTMTRFAEENLIWKAVRSDDGTTLVCCGNINTRRGAVEFALIASQLVFTLVGSKLIVWDISGRKTEEVGVCSVENAQDIINMILLETSEGGATDIIIVYNTYTSWFRFSKNRLTHIQDSALSICNSGVVVRATAVDSVSFMSRIESSHKEIMCTLSSENAVQVWAIADKDLFEAAHSLTWIELGVFDAEKAEVTRMSLSSTGQFALAREGGLVIWNIRTNAIELQRSLDDDDTIRDLDWTETPGGKCLLSVGHNRIIEVLCQQRYDYVRALDKWIPIRVFDVRNLTEHPYGDSIWLRDGTFVVGVGNQLFIQDAHVDMSDDNIRSLLKRSNTLSMLQTATTLFDVDTILNGPLPLYHPQLLVQLMLADCMPRVYFILNNLDMRLRYAVVQDIDKIVEIDSWLEIGIGDLFNVDASIEFTELTASNLQQQLQKVSLPYVTRHQQITLLGIVQTCAKVRQESGGLDNCAIKYLLGYQLYLIHKEQSEMTMRDYVWAYFSNTKSSLVSALFPNQNLSWPSLRACGIAYWVERATLLEIAENLAKSIFASTRDPVRASLLYLALRKKNVLEALWRVSSSHSEQQKTIKLLGHNYTEQRWKVAAKKNAFALLSKHRYEYAAALFILGDSLIDACNVLIRNVGDTQLAILIARLYEGDSGPALAYIFERSMLSEGNTDIWHRLWAKSLLNLQSEILLEILDLPNNKNIRMDPVILFFFRYLKSRFPTDRKRSLEKETKFILHASSLLCEMGCDIVALLIVYTWRYGHYGGQKSAEWPPVWRTKDVDLATKAQIQPLPDELQNKHQHQHLKPPFSAAQLDLDMSAFDFGF